MNAEIIQNYLQEYIARFDEISQDEIYKWRAVKHFQDNWPKNFTHFKDKLEVCLAETYNLLRSGNYFPRNMLIENAELTPDVIEGHLHDLYDEAEDLSLRIVRFIKGMDAVNQRNFPGKKHYQDHRAVMVYLSLRYPDTYFLYKYEMFSKFAQKTNYHYKPKKGRLENILQFNHLCKLLKQEIRTNEELLKLHYDRLDDTLYTDSNYNILTQDFVFAVARYFEESEERGEPKKYKYEVEQANLSDYVNEPGKLNLQGRIVDYEGLQRRNKRTGLSGEEWVLKEEILKLEGWGKKTLSERVKQVSVVEGDGLGYDILSFDEDGKELYIEVKTTTGNFDQPFFITANEMECSRRNSDKYRLYRVYQFDSKNNAAKVKVFSGSLDDWCNNPISYRVKLKPMSGVPSN